MKNKILLLFFLILPLAIFAQDDVKSIRAGKDIVQIEINTNFIDIEISTYDKNFISYKVEEIGNKKIFTSESKKKLQFYTTAHTKGKITIYVPEEFLLESCRIQATNSKVSVQNIKSIYFVASVISSDLEVSGSKFKNVLLATTHSNIKFTSGIIAVADFTLTATQGIIEIAEEMKSCNLFMTQIKNKHLMFNGKVYKNTSLSYQPTKKKKNERRVTKHISISSSFSNLDIKFIPPMKNPSEKFDQYGISEFGPVPPPKLVDPVSNFLPKQK